jgi:hypothetical protein
MSMYSSQLITIPKFITPIKAVHHHVFTLEFDIS